MAHRTKAKDHGFVKLWGNALWKTIGTYQIGFKPKESRTLAQIEIGQKVKEGNHMAFIDI